MIELDALTKSYRGAGGGGGGGGGGPPAVHVLKGLSCRIARGDFVAIMGASGSGKSTLLNILGFLERPDGGSYRLEGADLSLAGDDVLSSVRNRKIGFVFQQFPLIDHVSALRNVMLPLLYNEDDAPDGSARALRMLESVGLAERAQHRPSELSGGEQQRVAIARALINDPALILADEPTGNLDAKSGGEILDVLQGVRTAGRTIVLVTHDRAVAERADRILLLEDGRLTAARTVVA